MKSKKMFKVIARINKLLLPSLTKKRVDLAKATKLQMILFCWRLYVTKKAID